MATIPVDSRLNSKTAEFFSRQHRMLIDGRFVLAASGKTFPVYNPATGEVVAQVPEAETEDVDRAVIAARRAFDEGPWTRKMSNSERGQLLWKLADLLQENLEEFAEIESLDNGKPLSVARVADVPLGRRHVPLHGRLGNQDLRLHAFLLHARRLPLLHHA